MMARPCGELAVAPRAQFPADCVLADRDAKFFPHPLRQIDQTPANHTVHRRHRPALDDRRESPPLCLIQPSRWPRHPAVDQPLRPLRVEAHHPIADDLQANTADPCRIATRTAVIDRRQRQQPACLVRILRLPRVAAKLGSSEVRPQGQRGSHGEPRDVRPHQNHISPRVRNPPRESMLIRIGIKDIFKFLFCSFDRILPVHVLVLHSAPVPVPLEK